MNTADARQDLGKRGEAAAALYLHSLGWENIRRNYRIKRFEIDIIARKDDHCCLFEVKTRRNRAATNIISERQKAHLRLAHRAFCEQMNISELSVSYALIIISVHNGKASLEYYPHFL
ncbi:MAG: YraN family protein [bacterium]|nr:YraN family protein [bacterium]